MRDLSNGKVEIDSIDFGSWCNCSNFPYNKCDECEVLLGNLKHMKADETFILKQ